MVAGSRDNRLERLGIGFGIGIVRVLRDPETLGLENGDSVAV
jgi:hypothetical protein